MKINEKNDYVEHLWDKENKVATCIYKDRGLEFTGTAKCHPEDEEVCSELIGQTIAASRARISAFRYYRNEALIEYRTLKQLYYSMNNSTHYNSHSYEAKMIKRKLKQSETDLKIYRDLVKFEETNLHFYITQKDKQHEYLRRVRAKEGKSD